MGISAVDPLDPVFRCTIITITRHYLGGQHAFSDLTCKHFFAYIIIADTYEVFNALIYPFLIRVIHERLHLDALLDLKNRAEGDKNGYSSVYVRNVHLDVAGEALGCTCQR
jgi:hypothetical protein